MGKKKAGGVRVKQMGGPKGAAKNPMDMMPTMEDFAIKPEDQIHLPPTPDRNTSIVWPIQETFTMKTDQGGFQMIYPSYLDAGKTVKQGRRVAKAVAVPKPTVSDMSLALQALKIRHVLQPYKGYSRDPSTLWENPGRVVVDMSSKPEEESASSSSSESTSKSALMRKLCERIPHLPERVSRLKVEAEQAAIEQAKQQEEQQKLEAAAKKTAVAAAAASSSSSSKKKGKKGRKK